MSDFDEIAKEISKEINVQISGSKKGISIKELNKIVTHSIRNNFGTINCYPGLEDGKCEKIAFFISLSAKKYIGTSRKNGHLTFAQSLKEIVMHMQGRCPNKTYHAVFITDNWQPNSYDEWRTNLHQIKKNATLDIYLINPDSCNRIKI